MIANISSRLSSLYHSPYIISSIYIILPIYHPTYISSSLYELSISLHALHSKKKGISRTSAAAVWESCKAAPIPSLHVMHVGIFVYVCILYLYVLHEWKRGLAMDTHTHTHTHTRHTRHTRHTEWMTLLDSFLSLFCFFLTSVGSCDTLALTSTT